MFCPNCGVDVKDANFCPECGTAIDSPETASVESASDFNSVAHMDSRTVKTEADDSTPTNDKDEKGKKNRKTRKLLIALISVILVIGGVCGSIWAIGRFRNSKENNAQDSEQGLSIDAIYVSESDIQTYETASVLVEVKLKEGDFSKLKIVDEKRKTIGTVNDKGVDGDRCPDDGVYSGMISFYSENAVPMNIYALYDEQISDKYETIYFYPEYKSEYYYEYLNLDEELNEICRQYPDPEEAHNAAMDRLTTKKENGEIGNFVFESGSIVIDLNSGATYVYSYNPGGEYKGAVTRLAEEEAQEVELFTISPKVNTILTIQPYRSSLGAGGVDDAAEAIEDSDYNFVFSSDSDNASVSIELLKELNRYNVIILDGHGGHSTVHHSFFGTGTEITDEREGQYWADLYYDRLIHVNGGRYAVTAAFFERHYEYNDFGDTIVYLGCCHGADDSVLADTLIAKGVDAVLAYKNSVTSSYDKKMVTTIFEELSKEQNAPVTLSEALNIAQSEHGVTDNSKAHWYNWLFGNYETEANRARLYIIGDKNYTLSMESGSLRGKVADCTTGISIENAYVTATASGANNSADYIATDYFGNFNLPLEKGTYDLMIQANGYLRCDINNIRVENNATTYLENTILLEQKDEDVATFISGQVVNAVTGEAVENATILFRKNYNQVKGDYVKGSGGSNLVLVSDADGNYYSDDLAYGYYTAEVSKDGFATQYVNVVASDDEQISDNQMLLIAPEAQGSDFRITLEWAQNPRDEDAHIVGDLPWEFHVYYNDKTAYNSGEVIANLDHDDTRGNGFETITLKADPQGTYHYYVHHYAGSGSLSTSNAIVKVYQGGVMVKQYNVPVDQGTGVYWNVFDIVNGKVVSINRISDSPSR